MRTPTRTTRSFGWQEGRDPNAFFSTTSLSLGQSGRAAAGVNPLAHFDRSAGRRGALPSLDFDPAQYLLGQSGRGGCGYRSAARTFCSLARRRDVQPFAPTSSLNRTASTRLITCSTIRTSRRRGRSAAALPDRSAGKKGAIRTRCSTSPAICDLHRRRRRAVNPLDHYHLFGWHEGRDPSVALRHDVISCRLSGRRGRGCQSADALTCGLATHEGRSTFADGVWG